MIRPFAAVIPILLFAALLASCNIEDEDPDIPPTAPDDTAPSGDDDGTDDTGECADEDEDGWCVPQDCNDHNPFMNPSRAEDCFDTIDNDCNGFADEADPACAGPPEAGGFLPRTLALWEILC